VDTRWPKLKASEVEQALYQKATYKLSGSENIRTIAVRKVWKVGSCRQVMTEYFREFVRIGYHLKGYCVKQKVIMKKPNKPKTCVRSWSPIVSFNCLGKVLK